MQMPRIVKLNLSHNDLNVTLTLLRIAVSPTCATTSKKATENSWNNSFSQVILWVETVKKPSKVLLVSSLTSKSPESKYDNVKFWYVIDGNLI